MLLITAEAAFIITPLSPPEDCPGWGCVCADKPAQAKVVAPDNCQAFITCDGKGNGSKALCPIAGTGFSPDSGACKPLDGPPDADNKCNFADSSVAAASFAKQSGCRGLCRISVVISPCGACVCTTEHPWGSCKSKVAPQRCNSAAQPPPPAQWPA